MAALELADTVLNPQIKLKDIVQSCHQLLDVSANTEPDVPNVQIVEYTDETVQILLAAIKASEPGEPKKSSQKGSKLNH